MPTITLQLKRPDWPGGVKHSTVAWNGNAEVVGRKKRTLPRRRYLFEMEPGERTERLDELRGHCR